MTRHPPKVQAGLVMELRKELHQASVRRNYYSSLYERWREVAMGLADIAKRFSPDASAVREFTALRDKEQRERDENRMRIYGNGSKKAKEST